ncbi:hypothetical protein RvY_13303 [Ramazzottius varieornatus]|uniref:SOSS complex subunit A homolog n=1 Tax=Ramazzottius varieornatus TaxID=947166 RepID=A0A1D1VVZ2_RAMVA|nr:hypothetical protein RvY_13303 [Ramazzottius varieornatus]
MVSSTNTEALPWAVKTLHVLGFDKFNKLSETSRRQCLWLLKQLMKAGSTTPALPGAVIAFLRQLTAGDHWKNQALIEGFLDVFADNRQYLEGPAGVPILQMAFIVFSRLIQYHHRDLQYQSIKDREVDFCIDWIRTRFSECFLPLGKELARSLLAISKMPKMKEVWQDAISNGKALSSTFEGLPQLLQVPLRSIRWIIAHHVTTELDKKINFLLSQVRAAQHARYSEIFVRQYLNSPESELLLPEIIRFVVRVVHPTNEVLASDVLQRWNFILLLLMQCKTAAALNSSLLALFYDWLLVDATDNNIMFIEPAILLLMHIRLHNNVKVLNKPLFSTLITYLCKTPFELFPTLSERLRQNVVMCFRHVMEKRVVQANMPEMLTEPLNEEQRLVLRKTFPEIFGPLSDDPSLPSPSTANNGRALESKENLVEMGEPAEPSHHVKASSPEIEAVSVKKEPKDEVPVRNVAELKSMSTLLPSHIQDLLLRMNGGTNEEQCAAMEDFVGEIVHKGPVLEDEDYWEQLAEALAFVLKPKCDRFTMPATVDVQSIENSVQAPVFILCRRLWEENNLGEPRRRLAALLGIMEQFMPSIAFLLLYYLVYKSSLMNDADLEVAYADLETFWEAVHARISPAAPLNAESYVVYLAESLRRAGEQDHKLLVYLAVAALHHLPVLKDQPSVVEALVAFIDAWDLKQLLIQILQKKIKLFTDKGCGPVIRESLKWESIEQTFFWKLFQAHNFKTDNWMFQLLEVIDLKKHPEAAMYLIEYIKDKPPREEVIRELMRRDYDREEETFISLALNWSAKSTVEQLGDTIAKVLAKAVKDAQKKRTASVPMKGTKPENVTVEQVLGHIEGIQNFVAELDQSRQRKSRDNDLTQVLYHPHLQLAIKLAKGAVSASVKDKYREVFTLIMDEEEEEENVKSGAKKGAKRKGKAGKASSTSKEGNDDEPSHSEEEAEIPAPPRNKKQRSKINSD